MQWVPCLLDPTHTTEPRCLHRWVLDHEQQAVPWLYMKLALANVLLVVLKQVPCRPVVLQA